MARTVLPFVRDAVRIRESTPQASPLATLTSPPELPGLSRPVWLVIAASVPTALGWYGYYKFSVEEESSFTTSCREGRVTGCGGFGTLFPFVWCVLFGGAGLATGVPHADALLELGGVWIIAGQVNLYRRVNELVAKAGGEPPVYAWWALLPPPLDVVVGLRQVHFLTKYWAEQRGDAVEADRFAEEWFPFMSAPRFTLLEFVRSPKICFGVTKEWDDLF